MIEVMRELEEYGYRVAYYLLGDEQLAVSATIAALTEWYRRSVRGLQPASDHRKFIKRLIMEQSIRLRTNNKEAVH